MGLASARPWNNNEIILHPDSERRLTDNIHASTCMCALHLCLHTVKGKESGCLRDRSRRGWAGAMRWQLFFTDFNLYQVWKWLPKQFRIVFLSDSRPDTGPKLMFGAELQTSSLYRAFKSAEAPTKFLFFSPQTHREVAEMLARQTRRGVNVASLRRGSISLWGRAGNQWDL